MAKILTEGFFDEPVCSMNNSCNTEPCKVYKFNFVIQFPGGFEEEILDSCKACSEEEASDIFGKTYDLSGGKVVIDPAYEEEFNVALESMKKKSLKEDYDPSIPEWVKKTITRYGGKRDLNFSNIAWDKAKYVPDEIPTSNRDPRLKDNNRLNFFKFKNGNSDVFYNGKFFKDVTVGYDRNHFKTTFNAPWKTIISNLDDFGYIDIYDNSANKIKADRSVAKTMSTLDPNSSHYRGKGQHLEKQYDWDKHEYLDGYEWVMTKGQDKSGYILDPTRLQRKLDNIGFTEAASRLESFYNKLEQIRLQLVDLLSNLDVKNLTLAKNSDYRTNANIIEAIMNDYGNAVNYFKNLKDEVERVTNEYGGKTSDFAKQSADYYINSIFKRYAKPFRDAIKDAKEQLKSL